MEITIGTYSSIVDQIVRLSTTHESHYVCLANVHMLMEVNRRKRFARAVNQADLITPDGKPLTWALRSLSGIRQDRVAGMDLLPDLLQQATARGLPVYFYGGTEAMLDKTRRTLARDYPALQIAGMESPPFHQISPEAERRAINRINQSGAALVFVVLGCPKQEEWMAAMKGRIHAVMIGVGGALPVLIGMQKRAPVWMQSAGLEWVFRLCQEPRRLFNRYLINNSGFIFLFLKTYVGTAIRRRFYTLRPLGD